MENEIQQQNITPVKNNSLGKFLTVLLILVLAIIIAVAAGLAGVQFGKKQLTCEQKACAPCPKNSLTSAETTPEWKTGKFAGIFSYEYPFGWNVLELWGEDPLKNGMTLAIDPNPISTAPRGGPLATFTIWTTSGSKDPNKVINERMLAFNDKNYTDIKKEEISVDFGKIYHITAKVAGEMYQGEPVESYMFVLGQEAVIAEFSFNNDAKLSEMFKHVVLSIKKI